MQAYIKNLSKELVASGINVHGHNVGDEEVDDELILDNGWHLQIGFACGVIYWSLNKQITVDGDIGFDMRDVESFSEIKYIIENELTEKLED